MYKYDMIAVTNRKLCRIDFLQQIENLTKWGVPKILLREKDLSPQEYENLAKQVLVICEKNNASCILHNFVDVALKLHAPAIHLPLGAAQAETEKLSAFKTIGISTHSMEQIKQAEALGASYVTYGHVFETDCKKGVKPRGIEALREICQSTDLPVYAIGGINSTNIEETQNVGAAGFCIMSSAMQAEDFSGIQPFLDKTHL